MEALRVSVNRSWSDRRTCGAIRARAGGAGAAGRAPLDRLPGRQELPTGPRPGARARPGGARPVGDGAVLRAGHTWVKEMGEDAARRLDGLFQLLFPHGQHPARAGGSVVYRGQALAEIGYGARRATIAAPVDGRVLGFNPVLSRHPDLARRDFVPARLAGHDRALNHEYSTYRTGRAAQRGSSRKMRGWTIHGA